MCLFVVGERGLGLKIKINKNWGGRRRKCEVVSVVMKREGRKVVSELEW